MVNVRHRRRWRVWLVLGLSVGVCYGAVEQSVHGLLSHDHRNWTEMAVHVGAWAVCWLLSQLLGQAVARRGVDRGWLPTSSARRRRDREERLVGSAIEAGSLPADVGPEVWRSALRARSRELDVIRWWTVGGLAVIAGLVGLAAVVENGNAVGVRAVAGLIICEGVAVFQLLGRRPRVLTGLLSQLT